MPADDGWENENGKMCMGNIGWENTDGKMRLMKKKNKEKRKLNEVTFRRELKALQNYGI